MRKAEYVPPKNTGLLVYSILEPIIINEFNDLLEYAGLIQDRKLLEKLALADSNLRQQIKDKLELLYTKED